MRIRSKPIVRTMAVAAMLFAVAFAIVVSLEIVDVDFLAGGDAHVMAGVKATDISWVLQNGTTDGR